jgi:hypothetical protein
MEKIPPTHKGGILAEQLKQQLGARSASSSADERVRQVEEEMAIARRERIIKRKKEFNNAPPGATYHAKDPIIYSIQRGALNKKQRSKLEAKK